MCRADWACHADDRFELSPRCSSFFESHAKSTQNISCNVLRHLRRRSHCGKKEDDASDSAFRRKEQSCWKIRSSSAADLGWRICMLYNTERFPTPTHFPRKAYNPPIPMCRQLQRPLRLRSFLDRPMALTPWRTLLLCREV